MPQEKKEVETVFPPTTIEQVSEVRELFDKYYDYIRETDDAEQRGEWRRTFAHRVIDLVRSFPLPTPNEAVSLPITGEQMFTLEEVKRIAEIIHQWADDETDMAMNLYQKIDKEVRELPSRFMPTPSSNSVLDKGELTERIAKIIFDEVDLAENGGGTKKATEELYQLFISINPNIKLKEELLRWAEEKITNIESMELPMNKQSSVFSYREGAIVILNAVKSKILSLSTQQEGGEGK